MAGLRELRKRLKSIRTTGQLAGAMRTVAAAKYSRVNAARLSYETYAVACREMQRAAGRMGAAPAAVAERPRCWVLFSGNRGLCGGYNANIFRLRREYPDVTVIPIGKRACDRYGAAFVSSESYSRSEGAALAKKLCDAFRDGEYDRLGIVSSKYVSIMTQEAQIEWILPLSRDNAKRGGSILFEPDEAQILSVAVVEYVSGKIMAAVRESFACEVAARRMAMDSAGKNAGEMIAELQLSYNRARQSAITQEITEIVAGSGG